MLELILNSDDNDFVEYSFYPEKRTEFGVVKVNKNTGNVDIKKRADGDECDIYLRHAIASLLKYQKSNEYPERDTIAWY